MAPGGPWDQFPRPECSKRWHGDPFGDIFDFGLTFAQKHVVSVFCFAWKAVSLVVVACDRFISFSMRPRYWLSGQFRELVVTGVFVTLAVQKYHLAQRHVQVVG